MFSQLQILRFVNAYIDCMSITGYLLGSWLYKQYKPLRAITFLLLITVISNQLVSYAGMYYKVSVQLYHIFNPIQLTFLGLFFYSNFEDRLLKKLVPYIIAAGVVFTILNTSFLQSWDQYPTNFIVFETLLLIAWATMLFVEKLDAPGNVNIFKDPVFITAVAILSFNLFSFIFFLLTNYFIKHKIDMFASIYKILYFANIIYYGLLVVAYIFSYKLVKQHAKDRR